MTDNLFKSKEFSSVYKKYMIPVSNEITSLIISYMEEKNCKSYDLAVDVGCGTGRYTLPLAPLFKKVVGVDISESQLTEARHSIVLDNVTFQVGAAESLTFKDGSVDFVNAGLAAHWFNIKEFVHEAIRVLKPNGCLAAHAFIPIGAIVGGNKSDSLSGIIEEYVDTVSRYKYKNNEVMQRQYKDVFDAIPVKDKKWVRNIPVIYDMSMQEIIGYFQSVYMYQEFLKYDQKGAIRFLLHLEQRFRDILGEEADSAIMKVQVDHYCVLACK
uniref:Methyltransferase type 11 domain-containing protein n=1 Tax=Leptobrachium leishanense TaxID=445787 RepID=A0A8C5MTR2_9ANUR